MRVAIYTLGCKVNQYETQAIEKLLRERGHVVTDFSGDADAYVVNTCSVTAVSGQKSRQAVRRLRREHPGAVVAVCGCYAQTSPDEARALGVDALSGTGDRAGFVALLEKAVERRKAEASESHATPETSDSPATPEASDSPATPEASDSRAKPEASEKAVESCKAEASESPAKPEASEKAVERRKAEASESHAKPANAAERRETAKRPPLETLDDARERREFELLPAGGMSGRTRAMLKVEDGCNNFCSYCIIPYARGRVRSEPLPDAVRQARELAADGVREIVVTGIEISSWGRDLRDGQTLTDLTEALCGAVPGVRIRLGSLEPRTVTPDFCRRLADLPNLCPQFHLSLQSGCDETLKRMRRRYGTARYLESVELLREYFDRPAITTDLITGFPGETDAEFSQTLDFIRKCAFARMHIFPYSSRPGTPAAEMPQIPKAVKEERAARAAAVASETRAAYLAGCVGACYDVLFEQERGGVFHGHAPNYADVYAHGESLRNEIRAVRILSSDGEALYGEIQ